MQLGRGVFALGALTAVFAVFAESRNATEYDSIANRNAFGLKDAPPAPLQTPTNRPPSEAKKEEFYLTGISTIGTPKHPKAYLVAKDAQKKDYDQKYYNLAVGDRQGDVTLKEIDEKGRRVRIEYQGEDKWLTMKDNSVPTPSGPTATNNFPGNPMPGHPLTPPAAAPPPLPGANTASAGSTEPTNHRIRRNVNYGSAGRSMMGYGYSASPNVTAGVSSVNEASFQANGTAPNPDLQSQPGVVNVNQSTSPNTASTNVVGSVPVPPSPQP
jgi:hypothetical protein